MEATLDYAESHFTQLLQCVERGEEVLLRRDNVAVARLVPVARSPQGVRPKVGEITSEPIYWTEETFAPLMDEEMKEWGLL